MDEHDKPAPHDSANPSWFAVRKYPLPPLRSLPLDFSIDIPVNHDFCLFDRDPNGDLCVWFGVQVARDAEIAPIRLGLRGTGQECQPTKCDPHKNYNSIHLKSLVDRGHSDLVLHLFVFVEYECDCEECIKDREERNKRHGIQ